MFRLSLLQLMWNLEFHLAFAACLGSHNLKINFKSLLLRQTESLVVFKYSNPDMCSAGFLLADPEGF